MLPVVIRDRVATVHEKPQDHRYHPRLRLLSMDRFDASLFYDDPRIVDQIGARIYRYPGFIRVLGLIGVSIGLWVLLFMSWCALLSWV